MSNRYRNIFWVMIFGLFFIGKMSAQQSPQIDELRPFVENDSLRCRFAVSQLFAGNTRQTLLSGLPVLIQLHWQLLNEKGQPHTQIIQKIQYQYDIWEDRIFEKKSAGSSQYESLEALEKSWQSPEPQFIIAIDRADGEETWRIRLGLTVVLLTRTQGKLLKNWLFNATETEETLPGANRDSGFTLDLSRLFSWFFSRSDVIEQIAISKSTPPFNLRELQP